MTLRAQTAEHRRMEEARRGVAPWRKWGPYLSERQWGTVREHGAAAGDPWKSFPHDQARARAYHYGEDGLAGFCDERQKLCFAVALWNGRDAILKERLFGLTNEEGNHGEDVKEYYFYLDSTPTHAYLKYLYKYPQAAYPYQELLAVNQRRARCDPEYELLDTGVFDSDRYFDVFVEYAKAAPDDILISIRVENRGPAAAEIHLLPTLWFRNTWWDGTHERPALYAGSPRQGTVIAAHEPQLGHFFLYCEKLLPILVTDNETNLLRLEGKPNITPFVKDGINEAVVAGRAAAVNSERTGTKASVHLHQSVAAGAAVVLRLRLCAVEGGEPFGAEFDTTLAQRREEAQEFWDATLPASLNADARLVAQQALAGMLWTKQYYEFDLAAWLAARGIEPGHEVLVDTVRNGAWYHMRTRDVISMPDKWEYPWYAAWDLAFHAIPLSIVDLDFAKEQLDLMLIERYLHPSGQIPANEWDFSNVNPPVHAWATYWVYKQEKVARGKGDYEFLLRIFRRLLTNFTWWANRKDAHGRNVFGGGLLGLDGIGLFDCNVEIPEGGKLEHSDGTAWMAFYSLTMLQLAIELATEQPSLERDIPKFVEHFLWIASAMDRVGEHCDEMWDEEDAFFYDVVRFPDGRSERLRVRSIVGLLPLCATAVLPAEVLQRFAEPVDRVHEFLAKFPHLVANIAPLNRAGVAGRRLFSLLNESKLRSVLSRVLDEAEFLSPHGIRAISRVHLEHPYVVSFGKQQHTVRYDPAESPNALFGGNSNWRGPVWFPINALIVRALALLYTYYGDEFTIECPTGSGIRMTLLQVSQNLVRRLSGIFLRDADGRRAVFGGWRKFQDDPYWRDCLLFYECFHGENGAGIGASHQTGWTALVASLMFAFADVDAESVLEQGAEALARNAGSRG